MAGCLDVNPGLFPGQSEVFFFSEGQGKGPSSLTGAVTRYLSVRGELSATTQTKLKKKNKANTLIIGVATYWQWFLDPP